MVIILVSMFCVWFLLGLGVCFVVNRLFDSYHDDREN
jgi:hypothetical protein